MSVGGGIAEGGSVEATVGKYAGGAITGRGSSEPTVGTV